MSPLPCLAVYGKHIVSRCLAAGLLLWLTSLQTLAMANGAVTSLPGDVDADGVPDIEDICLRSPAGYPVKSNGCALLDGVLTGVRFEDGTADMVSGATEQLDFLANLLEEFPDARIELHAHSDNRGSVRDQAILTRARLRTVGTYLVSRNIRANRLVLRSFGGSRPLFDNSIAEGRANNNRIEVVENIR